jgi:hypothetical protein
MGWGCGHMLHPTHLRDALAPETLKAKTISSLEPVTFWVRPVSQAVLSYIPELQTIPQRHWRNPDFFTTLCARHSALDVINGSDLECFVFSSIKSPHGALEGSEPLSHTTVVHFSFCGKSSKLTISYLNNYDDTFEKHFGFGHGAAPRAQIQLVFEMYHRTYRDNLDSGRDRAEIMCTHLLGFVESASARVGGVQRGEVTV